VCGMALVRAESLGFVAPTTDEKPAPLVIPYSAALVTGTRAIVYLELPEMPTGLETAFQGVSAAVKASKSENEEVLKKIRSAFSVLSNVLDRPYQHSSNRYARKLWNQHADRLAKSALAGKRVKSLKQAQQILGQLDQAMNLVREDFAPLGQPTFEGREIVLGPRAGNHYLVRHGLQEGQIVVTQGNFKIDAEIQIQAKPSMMTPQGGGGGGHDHGDPSAARDKVAASGVGSAEHAGHGSAENAGRKMSLPASFVRDVKAIQAAYEQVAAAVEKQDLGAITAAFAKFGDALESADGTVLSGHARMAWKEFAMLLANDAAEGRDVRQLVGADRVFLMLKGHLRRMREQLNLSPDAQPAIERIAVDAAFQNELARVWERYLAVQKALAADSFQNARQHLPPFETAVAAVKGESLSEQAAKVWRREKQNLEKLIADLKATGDIQAMRAQFKPLAEEVGVLAKTFGFGHAAPVFELHCPMAFENKGAVWYQESNQVRNPYFGAEMLQCADRVEKLVNDNPEKPDLEKLELKHQGH